MHVWMINPYGPLSGEGWRDYRFTYAARALAARGHEVTWFTAAFDHHTKSFRTGDLHDGFSIKLIPTPAYASNISLRRLWFERVFAKRMFARGRNLPRPDVIIAADPPQFCGAAGRKLAGFHGARFVIDCLDLWPELFVSAAPSALRPFMNVAVQPLRAMRRTNVRAAALVIAVAERYRETLVANGARNAITIPIGVDVAAFRIARIPHEKLTLVYAGSLGEHYDLDTVFEGVCGMDVEVVIAGRGPAEERLRRTAPPNVRFLGAVRPDELPRIYAAADIGLAPYAPGSTVAMPLKVFDYLAAGLPIVTSLAGEFPATRYTPGNAASLRTAILQCGAGNPAGDPFVFDTHVLYERYADAIEAIAR